MEPARRTVEQACANWLAGRHGLRKSTKPAYLAMVCNHRATGTAECRYRALEKRHLDELVTDLMAGGAVPIHVKGGPRRAGAVHDQSDAQLPRVDAE